MTVTTVRPAQLVTETPLSFRKAVRALRRPQLANFRNALAATMRLGDDRGWQYWAGIHGLPLPMFCVHHKPLFLPWHRAYLYFFELALKDQDPTVSLPWWDWTSPASQARGLPGAYLAEEVDGRPNPLVGSDINAVAREQAGQDAPAKTFRNPDDPAFLPTAAQLADVIALDDFGDFQQQLEQLHDDVHGWVGGTMAERPFAAYDPIFWAHHSMVDRVWRLWQLRHPTGNVPEALLDEALPPFNITVRQTLDVTALGYDYAVYSSRTHEAVRE